MTKVLSSAIIALLVLNSPVLAQPPAGDMPGSAPSKAQPPVTGEQVYVQVCQACHMADAKGGVGAGTIPALASNPKLAAAGYPITMIVKGRGAMPALTDLLGPEQIAAVVTYVRTHFGNNYQKPVTEADVKLMMVR